MPLYNVQPISRHDVGPLLVQPVQAASIAFLTSTTVRSAGYDFRVPLVTADPTAALPRAGERLESGRCERRRGRPRHASCQDAGRTCCPGRDRARWRSAAPTASGRRSGRRDGGTTPESVVSASPRVRSHDGGLALLGSPPRRLAHERRPHAR